MVGLVNKNLFFFVVLPIAIAALVVGTVSSGLIRNAFPSYAGIYPYLGEKELDSGIADRILALAERLSGGGGATCTSTVSTDGSTGYVDCGKVFRDTIAFPRPGGEELNLSFYVGRPRSFRKVWSRTIEAIFTLPNSVTQGIYRVPGTETYFFRIVPGLPICLEIERSERSRTDVLVLVKIRINGREIVFPKTPGITYWIGGIYRYDRQCFDVVWSTFSNLAKGNLNWESYKPLMNLRNRVGITYLVELYVDETLLNRSMVINISIGPPYVHIHR